MSKYEGKKNAKESPLSDDSSDEELIDDEVFLARHLPLEIDEVERYNIGIKNKKNHGSALSSHEGYLNAISENLKSEKHSKDAVMVS